MKHPFRSHTPKHRASRKECKNYKSYLKTLKVDFYQRCGYCNDHNSHVVRSYVIDHFVPRKPKDFVHSIPDNFYYNLIYSCSFCNRAKSNTWPTRNPKKHNDGTQGFVMPTKKMYAKLFSRGVDGGIIPKKNNALAKWIFDNLDFELPIHSLNWKFEKFKAQEEVLNTLYRQHHDAGIKAEIEKIRDLRLIVVDKIDSIYNV